MEVQCYDHFLHLHLYSSLSTQFTSLHNFLAQVYLRYNLLESKSMYPQVELAIHIWSWSIHKLWVWKPCAFNSKGYKSSKHNTSSSIFSSLEVKLQFVHLKFQVKTKNWHLSNVITPPLLNTIILSLNRISLYGCPFSSTFFMNLKNNLLWIWNFRTLYWRLKNYYPPLQSSPLQFESFVFFWCIRMTKEIEVWEYELCMVCE